MTTDELKARMQKLKLPSDEVVPNTSSVYISSSPGSSLSSRPVRPRPSLGIPSSSEPFGLGSPISRRPTPGSLNLGQPLSRERLRFGTFPQPSHDEYERKLQEIMKLCGVLTIDGEKYPTPIEDLIALGDLGNGTCGHVVKMKHPDSGKIIACKQMRRTGNSEETKRIVMDMDVVLKSHDCREIVVCLGCFITASDVWICMELMATCFDKLLKLLKKPVPEEICGKVAVATLNALNYLKDKHGVIHRDVKPSNILLDYEGRVKLCDFGISGRLVDSKAKTRSAGCAAYMAPERINPPNPNKPDYDIRADVWSLGITLVELATGQFPYKDCNTEFEVLTKVIQDDPPYLPKNRGFSPEFCAFVSDCLLKNYKERPKYKKLLCHPFIVKYRDLDVDVGAWYHQVAKHAGDPNKVSAETSARKSSLETRHEEMRAFKPQPSPRMVKSWRTRKEEGKEEQQKDVSFSKLKFYTSPSEDHGRRCLVGESPSPRDNAISPRDNALSPRDNPVSPRDTAISPRDTMMSRHEARLYDTGTRKAEPDSGRHYEVGRSAYGDSSRMNGPFSRNNFTTSYHGSTASNYLTRPSFLASRSHEEYPSAMKSPTNREKNFKQASLSERNSPRDFGHQAPHRKYSFEILDSPRDYHYTPKGTRKYYTSDRKYDMVQDSPRRMENSFESPRKLDNSLESPIKNSSAHTTQRISRDSGLSPRDSSRKYPALPVPDKTRTVTDTPRESRSFLPSWKFGSWTLSSPLNLRRMRTTSSDRSATAFETRRLQPGYRSLNERDKQLYSSSGKSDNL